MKEFYNYFSFITDRPTGTDCFEGHSQKRLGNSVCDYIYKIDNSYCENAFENKLNIHEQNEFYHPPRIIGLEGEWGSGKSNVVKIIATQLSENGYYTYTYDAWAHQEDLQRRSILESLTSELIQNKVLEGLVTIKLRNGKCNTDTWKNQLSYLLSNKTTSIRKSTPVITAATKIGIFIAALYFVSSLFTDHLIFSSNDYSTYGWIDYIFLVISSLVILSYLYCNWRKNKNFGNVFRLIDYTNNDIIEEEYTSSEEPSVSEFKNWMLAISDYLDNSKSTYKKLVIVFDNMDRLPSAKVMQLWSTIYTFFSDGGYKRIWTIIPYDYKHLCQAVYETEDSQITVANKDRIEHFLKKTFPIIYHVPYPVTSDYRLLFLTYFDKAFANDMFVNDRDYICQVFMCLEPKANPRNVIHFINALVSMRLQWHEDKYSLRNQALYILKKNFLFYDDKSLDSQLLSENLFDKVSFFYPDRKKTREELCQYAYGLDDRRLASELPLRNELKRLMSSGLSILEYSAHDKFISVLEQVIVEVAQSSLGSAVKSLTSLDGTKFDADTGMRLKAIWDILANQKKDCVYDKHVCDETLVTIIHHAQKTSIISMVTAFIESMKKISVTDGDSYFKAFADLSKALKSVKIDIDAKYDQPVCCEPLQFVKYVYAAKSEYKNYGLYAKNDALNEYLFEEIDKGNNTLPEIIDYIIIDNRYDFSTLKTKLSTSNSFIAKKINLCVVLYVYRKLSKLVDNEKIQLPNYISKDSILAYLQNEQSSWQDTLPLGIEDVVAVSLSYENDIDNLPDSLLPRLSECIEYYFDYSFLLNHLGKTGSAFFMLNVYYIKNHKGQDADLKYVARCLEEFQNTLKLDISVLISQFNRMPKIDWGEITKENEYIKDVKKYVHQNLCRAYLENAGNFSGSIIKLGIEALKLQTAGFLAHKASNNANHLLIDPYWKTFVVNYLGTDNLKIAPKSLTCETVTMLNWLYSKDKLDDQPLLDHILKHLDQSSLRPYLHDMLNNSLAKRPITVTKFKYFGRLLPNLGSSMDVNLARGLILNFVEPVYQNPDCAKILIDFKEFYLDIMGKDLEFSEKILNDMLQMDVYTEIKADLSEIKSNV